MAKCETAITAESGKIYEVQTKEVPNHTFNPDEWIEGCFVCAILLWSTSLPGIFQVTLRVLVDGSLFLLSSRNGR